MPNCSKIKTTNNQKLYQIELARIIACLFVIAYHVVPFWLDHTGFYKIRLAERIFTSDGVPVFWAIFGYFLIGRKYKNILKNAFVHILLPSVIILCMYAMIQPWLYGENVLRIVSYPWEEVLFNLTHRGINMSMCPHLWYVFRYTEVALLSFGLIYISHHTKRRKICLWAGMIILLLTTMGQWGARIYGGIEADKVFAAMPPIISWISIVCYIFLGCEMRERTPKIQSRSLYYFSMGLAAFLAANSMRLILQYILDRVLGEYADKTLMGTANIFSFMSTTGLLLMFLSAKVKSVEVQNLVRWLGSKTFGIYLVHWIVMEKLASLGFTSFLKHTHGIVAEIIYSLAYVASVSVISLLLVWVFEKMIRLLRLRSIPVIH